MTVSTILTRYVVQPLLHECLSSLLLGELLGEPLGQTQLCRRCQLGDVSEVVMCLEM